MNTLLLNGCSFGECWTPTNNFIKSLGCEEAVNISKIATSFQRTCRSTVEWIAQNGNPAFVVIPVTFVHRWELAIAKNEDPIDGSWYPMQISGLINPADIQLNTDIDVDKLEELKSLYYGAIPTIKTFWDKAFTEIILLASFLEQKNIKYLFIDMCNEFDRIHIKGYSGFEKLKLIEQNRNIVDLFSFCGNRYMWNTIKNNKDVDVNSHHAPEQYEELEKYLLNYVENNTYNKNQ